MKITNTNITTKKNKIHKKIHNKTRKKQPPQLKLKTNLIQMILKDP